MAIPPTWQYDEFRQIGTDYESAKQVAEYDARMSQLRDIESHIREEFSTFGGAMEGLLQTSGFSILSAAYQQGNTLAEYICRKG